MRTLGAVFIGAGLLLSSAAFAGEAVTIPALGGALHGTLELPPGSASCQVALIIAGSGPTDRDGNSPMAGGKNNSLKYLAEALAAKGIASLRFDKRGVGESARALTKEDDLTFETSIDDAVLWGKELRKNRRFTRLTVIGHSEGSLIGMVACWRLKSDAFVSIAGAGFPASRILLTQLEPKIPKVLFDEVTAIVDSLVQGRTVNNTPASLAALFRPSVQPYLISWFRYNPAVEVARLRVPVLIVQGTTDIQVGMDDARELATSCAGAKLLIIEGMNHILKKVSGPLETQIPSYGDPTLPVAPELVDGIADFMMSIGKR